MAALIVVASHMAAGFLPALYFGVEPRVAPSWQAWFATSPLFVTINGSFAVYVFFVLSGFVIAASTDLSNTSTPMNCLARIIRLSIPCAVSVFLAAIIINGGMKWTTEAAAIVDHWWISNMFKIAHVPLPDVFSEAAGKYYWKGRSSLNGVLWTMKRELLGSLAIIILFGTLRYDIARLAAGLMLVLPLIYFNLEPHYYLCFVAGAAFYVLHDWIIKCPSWVGAMALAMGLLLGGAPFVPPPPDTFYFNLIQRSFNVWAWAFGAMLIVLGTLLSPIVKTLLGSRCGRFLGRISFGVYLVHYLLLQTVMAYLFVKWGHAGRLEFLLSAVVYVAVVVATGFVFAVLVDEPTTKLCRRIKGLGNIEPRVPIRIA